MRTIEHRVDFCVVGGGLAGMCAAIAAARRGLKVALMHDRPVPGGNASSEIRMWVCGAHGDNNLETGIIEEIQLENLYRNNNPNYSVWDSILYEKLRYEPNITLLLNCSCNSAEMDGSRVKSVKGWQLTSETWHCVTAKFFADCSGDSILIPLTGAEYRYGREASAEFGETIEPELADDKTMGMSCLIQARETDSPKDFIPPSWAYKYQTCDRFPYRGHKLEGLQNFWWLEIGGLRDTVHDCEEIRDELLKIAFGVWDHIKNHCEHREASRNWVLDWLGFLPGKRESRRYVGDHIITQNDVRSEGRFDDIIAYGGWSMDDHHPEGFEYPGKPTIFHEAPSPYGIPYRALYSRNIDNLFCAGRNISATHAAMSSTRVMSTCAILGEAAGVAAAIAAEHGTDPRGVGQCHMGELQDALQWNDCMIPWRKRKVSGLTSSATLKATCGNPEALRNGWDRPNPEDSNAWECVPGSEVEYAWNQAMKVQDVRLIFDSDLNRNIKNMPSYYRLEALKYGPPESLVKAFAVECRGTSGEWERVYETGNNYQRRVCVKIGKDITALRLRVISSHGADRIRVFAMDAV